MIYALQVLACIAAASTIAALALLLVLAYAAPRVSEEDV